jgi:hypothetical protein
VSGGACREHLGRRTPGASSARDLHSVFGAGSALAYLHADQPIAQVEISGNCNNPSFDLCAPEEQGGVGVGGVWTWAELDTAGTDGTYGSMDYTIAFCGHTIGGGGPGSPGGGGGPGEGEWWTITNLADAPGLAFPFFDTSKSYDAYYVLDYFPGSGDDDFIAVVPAAYGHYGLHPIEGSRSRHRWLPSSDRQGSGREGGHEQPAPRPSPTGPWLDTGAPRNVDAKAGPCRSLAVRGRPPRVTPTSAWRPIDRVPRPKTVIAFPTRLQHDDSRYAGRCELNDEVWAGPTRSLAPLLAVCPVPGCGTLTMGGTCVKHDPPQAMTFPRGRPHRPVEGDIDRHVATSAV